MEDYKPFKKVIEGVTENDIRKYLTEIAAIKESQYSKKSVIYAVDKKDGILKDYIETEQYKEKMQDLIKKTIKNESQIL